MKIAMIGSGAAGSVFAGYLRLGGADLTLVDPYKEHMDKIAKDGLTFVIYPDQEYQVTVTAREDIKDAAHALEIPYRPDTAAYWMGLGQMGGFRKGYVFALHDETENVATLAAAEEFVTRYNL